MTLTFKNFNLKKKLDHLHPNSLTHLHDAEHIKSLGKGTFGCVDLYKCVKCETCNNKILCNKFFVVKKICSNYINKKNIKKSLLNEYTISTLLQHPNIRKTLDIDLLDNCLIYEYFQGIDFYEYLSMSNINKCHNLVFDHNEQLTFYEQFINGVEYMHNIGIAHMDLKLENIMIDTSNTLDKKVKIIDFGESKVFHDTNHIKTVITEYGIHGSEPYIAPEEFIEEFYDPEKIDVWSCGIILYQILYIGIPWRKACINNLKYKLFIDCYLKKNLSVIFHKQIANDIFYKMLNPDPFTRCRIKDIKNEIYKLKNL